VSAFAGETVNGAFTVWVRRGLVVNNEGQFTDDARNDVLTIVAEGVAPYVGASTVLTRARQATRVLETRFTLALAAVGDPCLGAYQGEGGSPFEENFYGGCADHRGSRGQPRERVRRRSPSLTA
jgi:hypothetical protein